MDENKPAGSTKYRAPLAPSNSVLSMPRMGSHSARAGGSATLAAAAALHASACAPLCVPESAPAEAVPSAEVVLKEDARALALAAEADEWLSGSTALQDKLHAFDAGLEDVLERLDAL